MTVSATARSTGHPGYSETLPRTPESAGTARRLVRTALAAWDLEHLADDSAVVVSELVANAIGHTRGRVIRITVTRPGKNLVRIEVADKSRSLPVLRNTENTDTCGRGLALVEALTVRWGAELKQCGKHVWCELKADAR